MSTPGICGKGLARIFNAIFVGFSLYWECADVIIKCSRPISSLEEIVRMAFNQWNFLKISKLVKLRTVRGVKILTIFERRKR
jgi:hypothetical protein